VKLTTYLHLMPMSVLRGAVPALVQYVFVAWCLVKYRACLCSVREMSLSYSLEMPVRITSFKCTSVSLERNFDLFCFIREKVCSRV
jgi:hypothetical protein